MRIELTIPFPLVNMISYIPISKSINISNKQIITHICTDSRLAQKGDLFIALKGEKYDGNDFLYDANARGAISLGNQDTNADIETPSTNSALLYIAKYYKSLFEKLKSTVAVTGSVGKTSTKEFIRQILTNRKIHANKGNYNNLIGLAHTIFTMPQNTEYLITEMGMNHAGEISELSRCTNPDISIITNIGTAHIGNMGNRQAIADAKCEILLGMKGGPIIIPYDEPLLFHLSNTVKVGCNINAPYSLTKGSNGKYNYSYPEGNIDNIELGIISNHVEKNISMAITASLLLKIPTSDIKIGAESITYDDIRGRTIVLNDFRIFDDSYNASYESVIADLKHMSTVSYDFPLGVFLGDINELGIHSEFIHRSLGNALPDFHISNLYLKGKYANLIAEGAIERGFDIKRIHINNDIDDIETSIRQIQDYHLKNEIILFKASHSQRFDKIADLIAENERKKHDR